MASALAHPLFRTSSLEQGMHSAGSLGEGDIGQYHGPISDHRIPSPLPLPQGPMFLKDLSRSSSASTQSSSNMFQQPQFHTRMASLSAGRVEEYNRQQHQPHQHHQSRSTLPGLTTLASLATTREPQMRYVSNAFRMLKTDHLSQIVLNEHATEHEHVVQSLASRTNSKHLWQQQHAGK